MPQRPHLPDEQEVLHYDDLDAIGEDWSIVMGDEAESAFANYFTRMHICNACLSKILHGAMEGFKINEYNEDEVPQIAILWGFAYGVAVGRSSTPILSNN